jgi:hypothetical protein
MFLNYSKAGKFLLTAGLLAVLAQGLWQLPTLQDYLFPGNQWDSNLLLLKNESWRTGDRLTSLKLRIDYLEWSLRQKDAPPRLSGDWLVSFPFSEGIRLFSPEFFWHTNIYLASRNLVQVRRKLNYLDALSKYIQSNNKQEFSHNPQKMLGNYEEFQLRFTLYNRELNKLDDKIEQLSNKSWQK